MAVPRKNFYRNLNLKNIKSLRGIIFTQINSEDLIKGFTQERLNKLKPQIKTNFL